MPHRLDGPLVSTPTKSSSSLLVASEERVLLRREFLDRKRAIVGSKAPPRKYSHGEEDNAVMMNGCQRMKALSFVQVAVRSSWGFPPRAVSNFEVCTSAEYRITRIFRGNPGLRVCTSTVKYVAVSSRDFISTCRAVHFLRAT
jgi:hypothetical protein